jgi:large subunit ribosomal protein L17
LQNKEAIQELFGTVREKVGDRPGGYVRVIRTGVRPGDGAETAMIELVDFNTVYTAGADAKGAGSKRRTRRGRGKGTEVATSAKAEATAKTSKAKKVKDEEE